MKEIVKVDVKRRLDMEVKVPQIPMTWDYDKSVEKVRGFIYKWANITKETCGELYIARAILSLKPQNQPRNAAGAYASADKNWGTYCKDIDNTKSTVNRWLALWLSGGSLVGKLTGNIENYTPAEEIEMVRSVLGGIDLDPASCEKAQKVIKAKKYYTKSSNGLDKKWAGKVFLNPPYKMPLIRSFTDKLIAELPNIESAILLTNDQTDTLWWQKCAKQADLICMPMGRINFYTAEKERTSPTNGQTYFYYGDNPKDFRKVFSEKGAIVKVLL